MEDPLSQGILRILQKLASRYRAVEKKLPLFIIQLGHYLIVLGILWLRLHDVLVCLASNTVIFSLQYCTTYCHYVPVTVQGVTEEPPEPVYPTADIFTPQILPQGPFQGNIVMLNEASFFGKVKKGKFTSFKPLQYDINNAIEAKDWKERPVKEAVSIQYHEFLPLFSKIVADRLPLHRPGVDQEAHFKEGETGKWGPLNSLSRAELVLLKEWPEENTSKEFFRQSPSPFAALVLFAKNPNGGLQFFIDYQDINCKMIKNRYPLPLIKQILNQLGNAKIYTRLNV